MEIGAPPALPAATSDRRVRLGVFLVVQSLQHVRIDVKLHTPPRKVAVTCNVDVRSARIHRAQ